MSKTLMIQATASFAGKSFLAMSFCKIFADKGYKVAPFKAQNTSLNSFVTKDGKEIARAQALQAFAAGVEPTVEMNPILIKPKGESKSQLVVNGKPLRDIEARNYYREFVLTQGMQVIKKAFEKLEKKYELIIIEGAGSPAEINLYEQDIANMRVAEVANAPVILIADIERGGVFASIYGTINLLKEEHRKKVRGIVINKFRGDEEILKPGVEMIQDLTGKPVLGVIPFIKDLQLPDEDSVSL
ncbi:MAG: cobyric acid synthase, partial [Methanobacteriota archaeon]